MINNSNNIYKIILIKNKIITIICACVDFDNKQNET